MLRLILISIVLYTAYTQLNIIYNKSIDKLAEAKDSAVSISEKFTCSAPAPTAATPAAQALKKQEQTQNQIAYLVRPDVKDVYEYYADAPAGSLNAQ